MTLGMAQPALSAQIRKLEAELGCALVRRSGRGIELTEAGVRFHGDLQQVFGTMDHAVNSARATARGELGRLALGFIESTASTECFLSTLRRFRLRYPGIELVLREERSFQLREAISRAEMDCAFLRPPVGPGFDLELSVLGREDLVIAVPGDHALAGRARIALADVAGEGFIGLSPRPESEGLAALMDRAFERQGLRRSVVQLTPGFTTAVNLVAAGVGICIVPRSQASLRRENVRFLDVLDGELPQSEIAIAYDPQRVSPITRSFLIAAKAG